MRNKGQTTLEYLLIIAVVAVVITTLAPTARRVVPRIITAITGINQ